MDQNANYSSSTDNYKPPKPNIFTANITKNRTIIKTLSAGMNTNINIFSGDQKMIPNETSKEYGYQDRKKGRMVLVFASIYFIILTLFISVEQRT